MPDQEAVQAWIRRNEAARAEEPHGQRSSRRTAAPTGMFAPDELIAAPADGGVESLLIGGRAVDAHGIPRATKDLDIVPAPDDENLRRLVAVLRL